MVYWLILNYFKLNSFLKIKVNLITKRWSIEYKTPYSKLTAKQKKMSDKLKDKIREIDSKNWGTD